MLVGKGQPRQTDAWIQSKPLRILVSLPLIRRLVSRQTVTMSDKEKQSEKQCKLFRYEISAASQRCQHGMWAANFWHVTDWLTCYCTHFCSVFSAVPWWPLAQPWVDLCDRCIELCNGEAGKKACRAPWPLRTILDCLSYFGKCWANWASWWCQCTISICCRGAFWSGSFLLFFKGKKVLLMQLR
jgi:hypothetical protein